MLSAQPCAVPPSLITAPMCRTDLRTSFLTRAPVWEPQQLQRTCRDNDCFMKCFTTSAYSFPKKGDRQMWAMFPSNGTRGWLLINSGYKCLIVPLFFIIEADGNLHLQGTRVCDELDHLVFVCYCMYIYWSVFDHNLYSGVQQSQNVCELYLELYVSSSSR